MEELTDDQVKVYRTTVLIGGALVVGSLTFGGIVTGLILFGGNPDHGIELPGGVLNLISAGSVIVLAGSPWLADLAVPMVPRPSDIECEPEERWRGRKILHFALIEGMTFVNFLLFLLTGNWWSFGVAAAGVLMMIALLPRKSQLQQWLRDSREAEAFSRDTETPSR